MYYSYRAPRHLRRVRAPAASRGRGRGAWDPARCLLEPVGGHARRLLLRPRAPRSWPPPRWRRGPSARDAPGAAAALGPRTPVLPRVIGRQNLIHPTSHISVRLCLDVVGIHMCWGRLEWKIELKSTTIHSNTCGLR